MNRARRLRRTIRTTNITRRISPRGSGQHRKDVVGYRTIAVLQSSSQQLLRKLQNSGGLSSSVYRGLLAHKRSHECTVK